MFGALSPSLVLLVLGNLLLAISLFFPILAGPTAPLSMSLAIRHVGHSRNAVLSFMNLLACIGGFSGALFDGCLSDP